MYQEYRNSGICASYAQALLLWLKLVHEVNLSWWAVFSPLWMGLAMICFIAVVFLCVLLIARILE
jgi:hypothetical protein